MKYPIAVIVAFIGASVVSAAPASDIFSTAPGDGGSSQRGRLSTPTYSQPPAFKARIGTVIPDHSSFRASNPATHRLLPREIEEEEDEYDLSERDYDDEDENDDDYNTFEARGEDEDEDEDDDEHDEHDQPLERRMLHRIESIAQQTTAATERARGLQSSFSLNNAGGSRRQQAANGFRGISDFIAPGARAGAGEYPGSEYPEY